MSNYNYDSSALTGTCQICGGDIHVSYNHGGMPVVCSKCQSNKKKKKEEKEEKK